MSSQQIILNVDGMSCHHCSGTVQRTLESIDGVSDITVDLEGKKATFNVSSENLIEEAIKEITEAGYTATK